MPSEYPRPRDVPSTIANLTAHLPQSMSVRLLSYQEHSGVPHSAADPDREALSLGPSDHGIGAVSPVPGLAAPGPRPRIPGWG